MGGEKRCLRKRKKRKKRKKNGKRKNGKNLSKPQIFFDFSMPKILNNIYAFFQTVYL